MKPRDAESMERDVGQYAPEIQKLIHAARGMMLEAFHGATETADPRAHLVGYSFGSGYTGTVATLILSKTGVKIGIPYGSSLPDPAHLLAGRGKVHRHVAIKNPVELRAPELKELLQNAFRAWETRTGHKH